MANECPRCGAAVTSRRAKFCPRCGADMAIGAVPSVAGAAAGVPAEADAETGPLSARRRKLREVVVGWVFLFVGGAMWVAGLFVVPGARGWVAFGLGMTMFVVGLGCLVGEDKPEEGKRKRKKKKEMASEKD